MALHIKQIPVGGFDNNFSYVIYDEDSHEGAVVDPAGNVEAIIKAADLADATITKILTTHTHFDHIEGLEAIKGEYPEAIILVHELGFEKLEEPSSQPLHEDDTITLGAHSITVLHTPGHIDDAVCFFISATDAAAGTPLLITGDTLFVHGCGRTTEISVEHLFQSLQRLLTLPDATVIYPGHDYGPTPTSTLTHEKAHNRFLLAPDMAAFKRERLG